LRVSHVNRNFRMGAESGSGSDAFLSVLPFFWVVSYFCRDALGYPNFLVPFIVAFAIFLGLQFLFKEFNRRTLAVALGLSVIFYVGGYVLILRWRVCSDSNSSWFTFSRLVQPRFSLSAEYADLLYRYLPRFVPATQREDASPEAASLSRNYINFSGSYHYFVLAIWSLSGWEDLEKKWRLKLFAD